MAGTRQLLTSLINNSRESSYPSLFTTCLLRASHRSLDLEPPLGTFHRFLPLPRAANTKCHCRQSLPLAHAVNPPASVCSRKQSLHFVFEASKADKKSTVSWHSGHLVIAVSQLGKEVLGPDVEELRMPCTREGAWLQPSRSSNKPSLPGGWALAGGGENL